MAKIPDKQGLFFELDGVLVEQARLNEDGTVPFIDRAIEALGRVDPNRFKLFVATSRQDIAFGKYALIIYGVLLVIGHFHLKTTRLEKKVAAMDSRLRRQGGGGGQRKSSGGSGGREKEDRERQGGGNRGRRSGGRGRSSGGRGRRGDKSSGSESE